jgi:hypothetical protein
MVITLKGFKDEVKKLEDECDIDALCIRWLRGVSHDQGKEGEHAEKLLEVVAELLGIYA